MKVLFKIAFSKTLLFTYFFIGYLAISQHSKPESLSDGPKSFSTDQTTVPNSPAFSVYTAKHVRPDNTVSKQIDFNLTFQIFIYNSHSLVQIGYGTPIVLYERFFDESPSRGPPTL